MKFPDFVFSKPLPRLLPARRTNYTFGVLEIETSDADADDLEKGKSMEQRNKSLTPFGSRICSIRT